MTFYYCSSSPLTELQPCWVDLPRRASQRCENCWQLSGAHGIPWNPPKSLEQKIDMTNMDKHFKNWEFVLLQCLTSWFSRESFWILHAPCAVQIRSSSSCIAISPLSDICAIIPTSQPSEKFWVNTWGPTIESIEKRWEEKDKFDQDPSRSIEVCFPRRCSIKIGCCLDFRRSCRTLEMSQHRQTKQLVKKKQSGRWYADYSRT